MSHLLMLYWDVHDGNGTQWAFYENPNVLTISIHQEQLYPQDSGLSEVGSGKGVSNRFEPQPPFRFEV